MANIFRPPIILRNWRQDISGAAIRSQGEVWTNILLTAPVTPELRQYDWPNPRGTIPRIALRTHLDPLKLNLLGQDSFPSIGNQNYDWPNPRGSIPGIALRTWT